MQNKKIILGLAAVALLSSCSQWTNSSIPIQPEVIAENIAVDINSISDYEIQSFLGFLGGWIYTGQQNNIDVIVQNWKPIYNIMSVEIFNFIAAEDVAMKLVEAMKESTGQDFGSDMQAWYTYLWNQDEILAENYDNFKSELYKNIDPAFDQYFRERAETATIRLDEIRWWWVGQDGIPPLRNPEMISVLEADYLGDDDVVFGIEVNGDVRAYPKRILAWHEMFVDTVGWVSVTGVYCTLCGSVILYENEVNGVEYNLWTSGFLYRSNKVMYDKATQSLWSTITGEPTVWPLVWKWIVLTHQSVVTTTWGEWKARHPETQVLSLDTWHNRDYGEWVAYNEYFSTDRLMFHTPFNDTRLENKQEVLALRFPAHPKEQLAIDTEFLENNPIYYDSIWEQQFVVLTDTSGWNRVYNYTWVEFTEYDGTSTLTDENGVIWTVTESQLTATTWETLERLPYHRAFWFGWHAVYPESRLVK